MDILDKVKLKFEQTPFTILGTKLKKAKAKREKRKQDERKYNKALAKWLSDITETSTTRKRTKQKKQSPKLRQKRTVTQHSKQAVQRVGRKLSVAAKKPKSRSK